MIKEDQFEKSDSTLDHFKQQTMAEAGSKDWNEEYAAEITAPIPRKRSTISKLAVQMERNFSLVRAEPTETNKFGEKGIRSISDGRTIGGIAFLLAIISLFALPLILGPSAAIVGFSAYRLGSRALGIWSIVIGFISFASYLLLSAYYA